MSSRAAPLSRFSQAQHKSIAILCLALIAAVMVVMPLEVQAATFNPGCTVGVGDTAALQTAVTTAGSNGQPDTINLAAGCTYTLSTPLTINSDSQHMLTINGSGATLSGADNTRLLLINNGAQVVINSLTLTDGDAGVNGGGAIYNAGGLTLNDSFVQESLSVYGGGIYNDGSVILNHTTIRQNETVGGGGGIFNDGYLEVNGSVIDANTALNSQTESGIGGGIYNSGTLKITGSTISENYAANNGGGISNNDFATLTGSMLSGNRALGGGGLGNSGALVSVNSTFFDNEAFLVGGGILESGLTTLINSTLVQNTASGGGGVFGLEGTTTLKNSIVANNSINDCQLGQDGHVAADHSLIRSPGCGIVNNVNGNIVTNSADPKLGTPTGSPAYVPLLANSPAINAGDNNHLPIGTDFDQAGNVRVQDSTVDMGAAEVTPVITVTSAASVAEGSSAAFTLTRTGSTALSSTIPFSLSGTAGAADYALSVNGVPLPTNQVSLNAGAASVNVTLTAADDVHAEASEDLTLTILEGSTYDVGATFAATMLIPANDLVATTLSDSGEGSLRQAVANANAFPTDDTVVINSVVGTITLTSGALTLADNGTLTVQSLGASISAGDASRIFFVNSGAIVTLSGLRLSNSNALPYGGGAIYNAGVLTLAATRVDSSTGDYGGAIYNDGTLTLSYSTIRGNEATVDGGGIYNNGSLTIYNSTISANFAPNGSGGGIFSVDALTLQNSTLTGNSALLTGGIRALNVPVSIRNSIVANHPGGDCTSTAASTTVEYSLIGDGGCNAANGSHNLIGIDPHLGALFGQPGYHPLSASSAAINAGNNALIPPGSVFDQSGLYRVMGSAVDMGSFEYPYANLTVQLNMPGSPIVTTASVSLIEQGLDEVRFEGTLETNAAAQFTIFNLMPTNYELRIKEAHSLATLQWVTLYYGTNNVTTAALKSGDASGDNKVTIADFSILASTFGKANGQAGYDPRADFNGSGTITIADFSLLAASFGQQGVP